MMTKVFQSCIFIFTLFVQWSCAQENTPKIESPEQTDYTYEVVVEGIDIPWGMDFITANDFLVTEKSGILYRVVDGIKREVQGLPEIFVRGQGGLLDVALHPDYASNNMIYFTAGAEKGAPETGGNTTLYSAVLNDHTLKDVKILYRALPNSRKGQHWGSRIVFDQKGHVYFSIGDRGNRAVNPQDLKRDGGKIYRLNLDGSIPSDNPFVNVDGVKTATYSYGHRNPQSMTIHPKTGEIWETEHGPRGGDEINIIEKGKNFGWPVITYGINYSGTPITDKRAMDGMEQPLYYWIPSIAPSGMAFSSSGVYKQWKGDLFVGSLSFEYLERLVIKRNKVVKREKVLDKIGRVRNVEEGPDGFLYVGVEGKGILKIIPKK